MGNAKAKGKAEAVVKAWAEVVPRTLYQKLKMRMLRLTPWHGRRPRRDKMEVNMAKTVEIKMGKMEVEVKREVEVEVEVKLQMEAEVEVRMEMEMEVHCHLLLHLFHQHQEMMDADMKKMLNHTEIENGNWLNAK